MATEAEIKKQKEKMQTALKAARDLADLSTQEQRDFSDEERSQVAEHLKTAREAKQWLEKEKADADMRRAVIELGEGIELVERPEGQRQRAKTLGERFTTAEAWVNWFKQNAPGGVIPDSRKGIVSPPLEVKDFGLFPQKYYQKEVLTGVSDVSAGALVESERTGIYETLGRYPLTIRDLINVRTTGSDTVEFVRQTVQVTQAAPVAEANVTTYAGATGEISGEKPEATTRFERVTETVKTIAVWIPATKRALSDAAQLRGLIDMELRDDLAEELEDQILNGNGVGENFTGVANTANTLAQAFVTDIPTTTRKAITHLLVNGKQIPTAWMLNPVDWETVDLLTDNDGRYYWGGPMAMGPRTLWGNPVTQGFFQAQGTGLLANWRKAVLWDREQATISVSDSHSDFFIRNMVAILAEMRAAFGVIRPTAFCEVDLDAS
jgi:HK97 family phage major capsid protein